MSNELFFEMFKKFGQIWQSFPWLRSLVRSAACCVFSVLSEGESHIWVCKWWHPPSYFRRQSCFASVSSCCNMSPPPLSFSLPPLPLRRQWPSCENPPPPLRAVQHPPLPLTSCSAPKPIQLINCQSLCTDSKYRGESVLWYVESPGEQCGDFYQ